MASCEPVPGLLADLATGLWKLRQRLVDPRQQAGRLSACKPLRDVEMLLNRLREDEIEIQDHTGAAYDPSLSLRVAAFQPLAGLQGERILETLKPTVYHHQLRIQIGEVIVAIPERTAS